MFSVYLPVTFNSAYDIYKNEQLFFQRNDWIWLDIAICSSFFIVISLQRAAHFHKHY